MRAPCWKQSTGYIPEDLQARHVKYVLNQIKSKSTSNYELLLKPLNRRQNPIHTAVGGLRVPLSITKTMCFLTIRNSITTMIKPSIVELSSTIPIIHLVVKNSVTTNVHPFIVHKSATMPIVFPVTVKFACVTMIPSIVVQVFTAEAVVYPVM